MTKLEFWQQKLIQFFHDPPGKPYSFNAAGGHKALASAIFNAFTDQDVDYDIINPAPDWAAAGADRPVVDPFGRHGRVGASFLSRPWLSHPLAGGPLLAAVHADGRRPETQAARKEEREVQRNLQLQIAQALRAEHWEDPGALVSSFMRIWRRYREDLVRETCDCDEGDLFWEAMPADTRIPDHSIWDHLHVVTALAFLPNPKRPDEKDDPLREPWLLRFDLTPIQEFIAESRTPRDLWISSFLLMDLSFHAMLPIIEQYGPDNILYPDLRGNQRMDCWLASKQTLLGALPVSRQSPHTFAAVLPGTFTAVLPRGRSGDTDLPALEEIAQRCQAGLRRRWAELALVVEHHLRNLAQRNELGNEWEVSWKRQHDDPPIQGMWSAVPWRNLTTSKDRETHLKSWVPDKTWEHYQRAYEVFQKTNPVYLKNERGFDYPLVHHQLKVRQALRGEARPYPVGFREEGEKCTLCRRREALGPARVADQGTETYRQSLRTFWKMLDPDTDGKERLCGICSFKRYLVPAGGRDRGINTIWAGPKGAEVSPSGEAFVPFPMTAALAAQEALARVVEREDLQNEIDAVVEAHREAGLRKVNNKPVLLRLDQAVRASKLKNVAREFLLRSAQEVFFPHTFDAPIDALQQSRSPEDRDQAQRLKKLQKAVWNLRQAAHRQHIDPETRFAIVVLDGDGLGKLLLGEPDTLKVRWRSVLHPDAADKLNALDQTGWPELLDKSRHVTPSIHAFISRALAEFSHRIVPWVVEREYGGRLVYSGGDDVLALLPADNALSLVERLQQLYSASWVIDKDYRADPWDWKTSPAWEGRRFEAITPDENDIAARVAGRAVVPMLGPDNTLSAGMVYAHFKAGLSGMIRHAHYLLDEVAKDRLDRGAVALSYWSRNGEKATVAMKWADRPEQKIRELRSAFEQGTIPGRLPYKLREQLDRLALKLDPQKHAGLMNGLLREAMDGALLNENLMQDALALWQAGLATHHADPAHSLDGLLLCRSLALATEDEDDEEDA